MTPVTPKYKLAEILIVGHDDSLFGNSEGEDVLIHSLRHPGSNLDNIATD